MEILSAIAEAIIVFAKLIAVFAAGVLYVAANVGLIWGLRRLVRRLLPPMRSELPVLPIQPAVQWSNEGGRKDERDQREPE